MATADPTFDFLKDKQRSLRESFAGDLGLRVHRSISWIGSAERAARDGDPDAAFIGYWIAFNAAYAQVKEIHRQYPDAEFREWYFEMVLAVDREHVIYDAIWDRFANALKTFLDNKYVFEPFWKHHHGEESYDWMGQLDKERGIVLKALVKRDTKRILVILFRRLYVLRNQLIHGGATWGGDVNRPQVEGGKRIVACLVPHFVNLMMDHPDEAWGVAPYPVVD